MSDQNRPTPTSPYAHKSAVEAFSDLGSSVVKGTASGFKDIGTGMFDQLSGKFPQERGAQQERPRNRFDRTPQPRHKEKFTVFNWQQEEEKRTIQNLVEQLKQEVKAMEQAAGALNANLNDIQKITLSSSTEVGVYHVRFLEVVLSIIKAARAKINESQTWLATLSNRNSRRGFKSLTQKHGTKYSQSMDLNPARPAI